jgi:hypothetical protein
VPRKGWTRLPGSAERFLSPEGEVVSRRQYDNLAAQEAGWRNRAEFERRYDDPTYLWAARKLANKQGVRIQKIDRIGTKDSGELLAAMKTRWGKTPEGRSPRGPMARLLVDLGMRDPSATYAVGNTDGRKK